MMHLYMTFSPLLMLLCILLTFVLPQFSFLPVMPYCSLTEINVQIVLMVCVGLLPCQTLFRLSCPMTSLDYGDQSLVLLAEVLRVLEVKDFLRLMTAFEVMVVGLKISLQIKQSKLHKCVVININSDVTMK